MSNTYPITEEQKAVLSRFTCERLTAKQDNLYDIQFFCSKNGAPLVANLLSEGWKRDMQGSTAYYVIKNPEGEIVMFFSLKCGVLFDPDYVIDYMEQYKEAFLDDKLVKQWQNYLEGDEDEARYFHRLYRELGPDRFYAFVESLRIKKDKKHEPNKKIIRVSEARSAIELVEFCANDDTKDCWQTYGMGPQRKLGETMFWWFIVPKMLEINSMIGCEFVYLFAADDTINGKLSNYYREALHFNNITHLGTIKPSYDFSCFFMGNRLRTISRVPRALRGMDTAEDLWGLDHYQKAFFENFNQNPDADDFV